MHITPHHVRKFLRDDNQEYLQFKNALDIIGDKWSALIIICIMEHPRRFGEIEEFASGISPRTLTQRLHALEDFGLITRHEYKEFPPRTEYTATGKAHELRAAMMELKKWAHKYCRNESASN